MTEENKHCYTCDKTGCKKKSTHAENSLKEFIAARQEAERISKSLDQKGHSM